MRFLKTRQADAKCAKAKVDLLGLKNNVFKDIRHSGKQTGILPMILYPYLS